MFVGFHHNGFHLNGPLGNDFSMVFQIREEIVAALPVLEFFYFGKPCQMQYLRERLLVIDHLVVPEMHEVVDDQRHGQCAVLRLTNFFLCPKFQSYGSINICANLHKNSIYKPVEIKNQIPFPRVFAKMRIIKSSPPQIFVL